MVRWTSSSASTEPYIPCKRPHLLILIELHHGQPQALHFPVSPSKEPSMATWGLKPSTCILQLLLVFDYASLPLPFFLRRLPEYLASLRAIPDSGRACASLCRPPSCRVDIDLHPTSQCQMIFFACNLLPKRSSWPHVGAFRSSPLLLCFAKKASPGSSHAPCFHSSYSCCPPLPAH